MSSDNKFSINNIPMECYQQTEDPVTRVPIKHGDVYIEKGYTVEPVVVGLTYPTSLTFDDQGNLYIGESGFSYGPAKAEGGGRILRVTDDYQAVEVVSGLRGPVTGVTWHNGYFYVAEGGYPGRIIRIDKKGNKEVLVDNLPTAGDHYTSNIVFGPDGKMYFGVGTYTNSAVVGLDNFMSGWLAMHPEKHDIPPRTYTLRGVNYTTINPFKLDNPEYVSTGAFKPFGVPSMPGEVVQGQLKANGVIYRANPDGTQLEQYADGLRNPFALGFTPQGRLITVDQGYDARGSRPIANAPDPMWEIQQGGWYGFPDFVAGVSVTDPRFKPEDKNAPIPVLHCPPPVAPRLITAFGSHAAAMKFAFSMGGSFGHRGDAFVALFGSMVPVTGSVDEHHGHRVVRVNIETGQVNDFLVSKMAIEHDHHEAEVTGPIRPIDVIFSPMGDMMYVLDFGNLQTSPTEIISFAESGILWRIRKVK